VGDNILFRNFARIKSVLGISFSSAGFTCDLFVPREKLRNIIIIGRNKKKGRKDKSVGPTRQRIQKQKGTTTVPSRNIVNFKKPHAKIGGENT
jgi:hypothetical protein